MVPGAGASCPVPLLARTAELRGPVCYTAPAKPFVDKPDYGTPAGTKFSGDLLFHRVPATFRVCQRFGQVLFELVCISELGRNPT